MRKRDRTKEIKNLKKEVNVVLNRHYSTFIFLFNNNVKVMIFNVKLNLMFGKILSILREIKTKEMLN